MSLRFLLLMLAEHSSTRLLDAVTTLVLIRALDAESLGAFVADQSRVALLLLFFPALENMLYREYGRHRDAGTLGREVAAYRWFNAVKLAVAVALTVGAAAIPAGSLSWPARLAAFGLAFALPLAQSLYGLYRETLRFELRQGIVVVLNAAQRLALIAAIVVAGKAGGGHIAWIGAAAVTVLVLFGGAWRLVARRLLGTVATATITARQAFKRVRTALSEAVLWIHLAGAIMAAVQTLDVYFLSRAGTALSEVAAYSVALKAANFFQLIPLPLAQFLGVYLGRNRGAVKREKRLVWLGFATLAVLGVVMVALGDLAADPILGFLSKGKFAPEQLARAGEYFRPMLLGVALQTLCFAHGTYLTSRGRVGRLAAFVHLPWFVFSAIGYAWAASIGPAAAARFNVPVAAFYSAGHILFFLLEAYSFEK